MTDTEFGLSSGLSHPGGRGEINNTKQSVSGTEWTSIQAQIERSRYRLESDAKHVEGVNPEQGWKLEFDSHGLSLNLADPTNSSVGVGWIKPKADPTWRSKHMDDLRYAPVGSAREKHAGLTRPTPYALKLRTTSIGRADALIPIAGATLTMRDNRAEFHHAQATEWYVNSARGVSSRSRVSTRPRAPRPQTEPATRSSVSPASTRVA
ncbi:MAG: hypothetical protein ACT4QA_18555 [Panacagrimonas sp.]